MQKIKLGCDPELFVTNLAGQPRSAYGLIPGTKEKPHKVNCGAIQVDGMALEFNIDPVETEEQWVNNIATVMQELREATPKDFKFLIEPSVNFHHSILKKAPDEAKELGCMPDLDAYTLEENPRPNSNTTLRTASGHIHIGLKENVNVNDEDHIIWCATLAKHLDLFLGLRSFEWDTDKKRRRLYGNPGAIRVKPYGVEYRVLSNKWLSKESLVRFVYRQTLACIEDLKTNGACSPKDYKNVAHDIKQGCAYFMAIPAFFSDRGKSALKAASKIQIGDN